jgi:hypothetical protein
MLLVALEAVSPEPQAASATASTPASNADANARYTRVPPACPDDASLLLKRLLNMTLGLLL